METIVRLPTTLCGVHAVAADSDRHFHRHFHDEFGIGVIERGAQRSASGRGMTDAVAGELIMVNPGEVHDGAPLGAASRAWHMLYFDPGRLAEQALDAGAASGRQLEFTAPAARDPVLAQRFRRAFRLVTAPHLAATALAADEACLLMLARLLHRHCAPRLAVSNRCVALGRVQQQLDDDPAAPHSLDTLAREAGLGRFQLLRAFSRQTGLTPHQYLITRRVALARAQIVAGRPLADAALTAGFADQSHMTRAFVQRLGLRPGDFARAGR